MSIEKIIINDYSFYLEDYGENKGKVIITNWDNDLNFSYYWSAMGMDLKSFLQKIDNGYFLNKMIPREQQEVFSSKNTAKNIRKIWKEEIMQWYEHLEFQKSFREKLKSFLDEIIDQNHFIYAFDSFINSLDYHLINGYYESKSVEENIREILSQEPWHLIETEPSMVYKNLSKTFDQLKLNLKTSHL